MPPHLVAFYVGKGLKLIAMDKQAACRESPVLRAAFEKLRQERQIEVYKLEDVDEGMFDLLQRWMLVEKVDLIDDLRAKASTKVKWEDTAETDSAICDIVSLCVLGHNLRMNRLQDHILRFLRRYWYRFYDKVQPYLYILPPKLYPYIYENTPRGHPLRRLVVAQYCVQWYPIDPVDTQYPSGNLPEPESLPSEMMGDIMYKMEGSLSLDRRTDILEVALWAENFLVSRD